MAKLLLSLAGVLAVLGAGYWLIFTGNTEPAPLASTNASANVLPDAAPPQTAGPQAPSAASQTPTSMYATLHTNLGDITFEFLPQTAPKTVANFEKLASEKFYDGTKFHRVIKGFMIQGGDPLSKDDSQMARWGTGGPGYTFPDELSGKETYPQGTVAMANSGPDTNGSQFFIVTASPAAPLPPKYTVFGRVVSGMDTALKIENVKTYMPGQVDRPIDPVTIESVTLK